MSNLALYFAHQGRLFKFHEPCLIDVSHQLSLVNFPSESSSLPVGHMSQWIKALVRSNDIPKSVGVQYPVKAVENFQRGN